MAAAEWPPNFSWVVPGALAASGRPRSAGELERLYSEAGVRGMLTLTEAPLPPEWLHAYGSGATLHIRVPNFSAPSPSQLERAVAFLRQNRPALVRVEMRCVG